MGKRAATSVLIAAVAVLMVIAVLLVNRSYIFQEGNPIPVFRGIYHLVFDKEPYFKIKEQPPSFITKEGEHDALFAFVAKTYGVKYKEQMGAAYVFEGDDGKQVLLTPRLYSRSYQIWALAEK